MRFTVPDLLGSHGAISSCTLYEQVEKAANSRTPTPGRLGHVTPEGSTSTLCR